MLMTLGVKRAGDQARRRKTLRRVIIGYYPVEDYVPESNLNESLILAQNQRWRRASDMQVERERLLRGPSRVAHG